MSSYSFDFVSWTIICSLVFSLLSAISTSFALIIFGLTLPKRHINIRTKLVINLLIAEWINSTNNSISGIFANFNQLYEGPACTANGFIGQWSVQAADLSTLLIAVVTFLVLKTDSPLAFDTVMTKLDQNVHWIISFVWLYPMLTATIAQFVIGYGPAGNWCWIKNEPKPLGPIMRYSLTHVLRMVIFLTIIVLYTTLAIHLRKVASEAMISSPTTTSSLSDTPSQLSAASGSKKMFGHSSSANEAAEVRKKRRVIRAAILRLVAFPTVYVILWLPGIFNRILEASGVTSPVAYFLQSFTQLIGFADAALCMWNLRAVMQSKAPSSPS